ncbi:MAG: hypothetical protein IKE11_00570 [Clostridia bacterium]|nr:hypothetical protein [Clostridia bacterium]
MEAMQLFLRQEKVAPKELKKGMSFIAKTSFPFKVSLFPPLLLFFEREKAAK